MTGSWLRRHFKSLLSAARMLAVFVLGIAVGIGLTPYIQGYRGPLPWDALVYLVLACLALGFTVLVERSLSDRTNGVAAQRSG